MDDTAETMSEKQKRINNLFHSETGNAVMIPMDHGIMMGVQKGLEDPIKSVKRFVDLNPDALLMNFGVLKQTKEYFEELGTSPGIILGIDFNQTWQDWKTSIDADKIVGHCQITKVKNALNYGADAVKVYFPLGLKPSLQLDYVRDTAEVINQAEQHGIPVIVEPVTIGKYISEDRKNDPEVIADGCRLALELGADIIKAPYPGSEHKEEFKKICENSHIPFIILGGPKEDGVKGVLETAREGIDAGARGTIFGRNVWQRPIEDMKNVVRSLQDIVHRGASVEKVVEKYNL